MRNSNAAGLKLALAVVVWQLVVTLVAAALFWLWVPALAPAALFGGMVIAVPTAWFAMAVFVRGAAVMPRKAAGVFYRAEAIKFVLMALGFALGAVLFGERFAALMIAAMAALAVHWVMLAVSRKT